MLHWSGGTTAALKLLAAAVTVIGGAGRLRVTHALKRHGVESALVGPPRLR
ncbi:MAG: hypothetical protein ABIO63_00460 [Casimicrobiaceae bacterium]